MAREQEPVGKSQGTMETPGRFNQVNQMAEEISKLKEENQSLKNELLEAYRRLDHRFQ